MRVKVNGKRITIPYKDTSEGLDVNRSSDGVLVTTRIGIKVFWDGISFLEISAPTSYRERLCGLCGNFNHLSKDDFANRRGKILQDPNQFGKSWMVGGKKSCAKSRQDFLHSPPGEKRCRSRKDHKYVQIEKFVFSMSSLP